VLIIVECQIDCRTEVSGRFTQIARRIPRMPAVRFTEIFSDTIVSGRHQSHVSLRRSARRLLICWVTREEALVPLTTPQKSTSITRSMSLNWLLSTSPVKAMPGVVVDLVDCAEMLVDRVGVGQERLARGAVGPIGLDQRADGPQRSSVTASPSVSTSMIASLAPDRASSMASACPIPEPAPVTTATFPANPA
jgi:hypothetical protein